MSSFPRHGDVRRKIIPASNPISIPSTSINNISNSNLDWSLPPSSPLSPLNSHHTASPPTDLPVDIRPGSPTSLLSVPMPNATSTRGARLAPVSSTLPNSGLTSPHSPVSPAPSTDLSSPETIQFALPSDFEPEHSQSDNESSIHKGTDRDRPSWREGPEGYASDSLSVPKTRQHKRIVPPLLMLNHKRSSSSSLAQRSSSASASPSPVAVHSRFHSQSNLATIPPRDSFIDLEDTLDDSISPIHNPNSMYPTPPRRNAAGGLFRHKQSESIRSVASASSMLPTFVDPSTNDTSYQALPPPSPGLNVPFGGGVVIIPGSSVSTAASPPAVASTNAWKMFSRDKDKDRVSKKKDLLRNIEETSQNDSNNNIRSTSSSPTHHSAPLGPTTLPKPSKLKQPKKITKAKSHSHPTSIPSPPSSSPILPLSSQPIPLPVPLPLPPTTNNLGPAARQDLIKKHRKLVKVLGEEPRVVGHLEFIGGTALIPGQGAGLGLHSTYPSPSRNYHQHQRRHHPHHPQQHPHHHHHAASVSASLSSPNLDALNTFLHIDPSRQKNREKGTNDLLSNRDNEASASWLNNNGARSPTTLQAQYYADINHDNEVASTLDRAYNGILNPDNGSNNILSSPAYNTLLAMQPKRRHSTPVASEFIIDEAERSDDEDDVKLNVKGNPSEKAKDSRSSSSEEASFHQANFSSSEPVLTSPVSSALSFSRSTEKAVGAYLRRQEDGPPNLRDGPYSNDERNVKSSLNPRSPVVSPSLSSPPPVLPPLTTSPPRLGIVSELFQNSNSFDPKVPVNRAGSTAASRNTGSVPLRIETTSKTKEIQSHLNYMSSPPQLTDTEKGRTAQEHQNELRSRTNNKVALASQNPTKSHTLPTPIPTSTPADQVQIRITLSPLDTAAGSPSSVLPSETATSSSKAKGKSRDRTIRTPIGPATFVPPQEPQDRKLKQRRPQIVTRSDSPESFMDLNDDDIESPVSVVDRDDALQRREMNAGANAISDVQPNPATPYSPISPSPLSAMVLPSMTLKPEPTTRTTGDASLAVSSSSSSSASPEQNLTIHRAPSTASLAPSIASILSVQTTSTSPDEFHPYARESQAPTFEQEKRKKMDKLAKLHRFLGDSVPVELVLGESYAFKDGDLPAFALGEGASVNTHNNKKPLWMRRRRSSSSAALPGYEVIDRKKDDLDSRERVRHVKRGAKMEQMFGTRPPSDLYLIHARTASNTAPNSPDRPLVSPTSLSYSSQIRSQVRGNVLDPSYKGKSKHVSSSAESYAYIPIHQTLEASASGGSLGRSLSKTRAGRDFTSLPFLFTPPDQTNPGRYGDDALSQPSRRRGSGDSNKPLLAFGQGMPVGGRLRDESENVDVAMLGERNSFDTSSVYMQYRQSLISLGDIVDKDDKASLAELRQYLQPPPHSASRMGLGYGYGSQYADRDYDSDDSDDDDFGESSSGTKQNDDALSTPTQLTPGSRSPNAPNSMKGEPSQSPPLSRRRSLPSRTSTLSLVSTLSGTSTLSSISTLSIGTTATSFSKGLTDIPGYYNAPRTEAEGRADMFKARRRRAAKLTNFFGVKYRDLFGEVLESIEAGMREDVRAGRMGAGELEELMMRVKKLRLRRDQLN